MRRLPTLTPKKVSKAFERGGFILQRTNGSHQCYKHPNNPEIKVIIPFHGKDIKRPLLQGIIKQSRMTVDEFLDLL